MLSFAAIQQIKEDAARKAKHQHAKPGRVERVLSHYEKTGRFKFPFLGDYVPEGWETAESIEPVLVDKSGFGADDEPALTIPQFVKWLEGLALSRDSYAVAIVEEGQFQIVVGVYRPDSRDFTHTGSLTEAELSSRGEAKKIQPITQEEREGVGYIQALLAFFNEAEQESEEESLATWRLATSEQREQYRKDWETFCLK